MRKNPGPEPIKEIIARLFISRGWGRRQGNLQLEQAWEESIGPDHAQKTRIVGFRRGILEVEVANSILLQELVHFHKRKLLEQLRQRLPGKQLKDLRFRTGGWKSSE